MLDTYAAGRSGDFIFLQRAVNHLLVNTKIKLQSLALCHTVVIPTFEEQEDSEFKASLCWITRFRFNNTNTNKQTTKITIFWSGMPLFGGWGSFCSLIDFLRDGRFERSIKSLGFAFLVRLNGPSLFTEHCWRFTSIVFHSFNFSHAA